MKFIIIIDIFLQFSNCNCYITLSLTIILTYSEVFRWMGSEMNYAYLSFPTNALHIGHDPQNSIPTITALCPALHAQHNSHNKAV